MGRALIVLSGGQDSTTAGFYAKRVYQELHAITFNYGQRHILEIESAKKVAEMLGVASHEVIDLGPVLKSSSPLVNREEKVGHYSSAAELPGGVEPTFVPGRNILFLSIAGNRAVALNCTAIVTGLCQEDFGGYWDCRQVFVDDMAKALNQGLYGHYHQINIDTPLMNLSKKDTVLLGLKYPGCMEALAFTTTSYDGDYPPNPSNHASLLRARGFDQAGVPDPLIQRAIKEKKLPPYYPLSGLVEGDNLAVFRPDLVPGQKAKTGTEKVEASKEKLPEAKSLGSSEAEKK